MVAAAAVEAVGDAAGGVVVARNVGVQQQQGDASDVGTPDVCQQAPAVGQRQRNLERLAVAVRGGLAQQRQRQAVRVEDRVGLLLPGVAGERLLEVAGLVQQADADQRHAEVGGGLEVVAGEDAEAAGVLRQDLGDAEFGGEVGDARPGRRRPGPGTSGVRSRYRSRSSRQPLDPFHHVLVRGEALHLFAADQAQEA